MTSKRSVAVAIRNKYGLKVKIVDGEFQITIPGRPNSTYYTDEPGDALVTARAMYIESQTKSSKKFGLFGA